MTVYLILDPETRCGEGALKIGYTKGNVNRRMHSIQVSCASELELVAAIPSAPYELEQHLHEQFHRFRLRQGGEWFENRDEIRDEVQLWSKYLYLLRYSGDDEARRWIQPEIEARAARWPNARYLFIARHLARSRYWPRTSGLSDAEARRSLAMRVLALAEASPRATSEALLSQAYEDLDRGSPLCSDADHERVRDLVDRGILMPRALQQSKAV
ncbi:hypothetical protein GCM10027416_11440 [Okibacterium endophyticum]